MQFNIMLRTGGLAYIVELERSPTERVKMDPSYQR